MPPTPPPDEAETVRKAQDEPIFVNRLNVPVQVFDPNKRPVLVMPFDLQRRHANGVFQVHGDHYRQFTSPNGSLSPFRDEGVPQDVVRRVRDNVAQDAVRAARQAAGGNTVPPSVTAQREPPPARLGLPEPVVLDTETAFEIQRASPDATQQERADLATFVLKRRAGDKELKLHPSLARYDDDMVRIADTVDLSKAPPEDLAAHPENAPAQMTPSTVTADGRLSTSDGQRRPSAADPDPAKQGDQAARALHGATVGGDPPSEQRNDAARKNKR